MADSAAQQAASEPATFQEYRDSLSAPSLTHTPGEKEVEPDPETGHEEQEPKGPQLTDDQKTDRKRASDERRKQKWYEERGEMRAELKAARQRLADLEASQTKREEPAFSVEGKPTLKAFLEAKNADGSGKFKTYEDAHEAFTDALTDWKLDANRAELDASREADTRKAELQKIGKSYQDSVKQWEADHDDYAEVKTEVAERLDSPDAKGNLVGNPLTAAILRSSNPPKLIDHIGKTPELLEEFSEYAASGDFETALERLGEVKASIGIGKAKAQAPAAPEKKEPVNVPRNPRHVGGRSTVVNRDDALRNAADKNDFNAFRSANKQKAKV